MNQRRNKLHITLVQFSLAQFGGLSALAEVLLVPAAWRRCRAWRSWGTWSGRDHCSLYDERWTPTVLFVCLSWQRTVWTDQAA